MLITMPDLSWIVYIGSSVYVYEFSSFGTLKWSEPSTSNGGTGTWRREGRQLITSFVRSKSKTWEAWDLPINPFAATGKCHMEHQTKNLMAEAINFHLEPGDVVHGNFIDLKKVKNPKFQHIHAAIIYPEKVKAGGSIAWICNNPGNQTHVGEFGSYKGKKLSNGAFNYAIFPDEKTGRAAIGGWWKKFYHGMKIPAATHDYASGEGPARERAYAENIARELHVDINKYVLDRDTTDFEKVTKAVFRQEGTVEGMEWARDDPNMPADIRAGLVESRLPPTPEELRAILPSRAYFLTRF